MKAGVGLALVLCASAVFAQPDRSKSSAWAHPVIANGRLYIRDQGVLLCYDIRSPGA